MGSEVEGNVCSSDDAADDQTESSINANRTSCPGRTGTLSALVRITVARRVIFASMCFIYRQRMTRARFLCGADWLVYVRPGHNKHTLSILRSYFRILNGRVTSMNQQMCSLTKVG